MTAKTELPTWNIFRPYGDWDDHDVLIKATVGGHEWITDRYAMVRADLLDGEMDGSSNSLSLSQLAIDSFAEAIPRLAALPPLPAHEPAAPIHAVYLAAFEGYDWTPIEKLQWQIRQDPHGEIVAIICGLRHDAKPEEGGFPGSITEAMWDAYPIVRSVLWDDRTAWDLTYRLGTRHPSVLKQREQGGDD